MARVIVSSEALLHQAFRHLKLNAAKVEVRVNEGQMVLSSAELHNDLPCESRWQGRSTLDLITLIPILMSLSRQPITLDLHDGIPGKLYAMERVGDVYDPASYLQPVEFVML